MNDMSVKSGNNYQIVNSIVSQGIWGWFIQRLSGVLLVVYLGVHLWLVHVGKQDYTAAVVAARLQDVAYQLVIIGLLVVALFHGLNGLRRIIVDVGHLDSSFQRIIAVVVLLIGLAGFYYGILIFNALAESI